MTSIVFDPLFTGVRPPERGTAGSAGFDLSAHLAGRRVRVWTGSTMAERETVVVDGTSCLDLAAGEKALVPLGFRARLPEGFEAQIRPRSGTSVKTDLVIANAPGTVDPDYPDEWCVPVKNGGAGPLRVAHGDRIAQMIIARFEILAFESGVVERSTDRAGGFGSTGGTAKG